MNKGDESIALLSKGIDWRGAKIGRRVTEMGRRERQETGNSDWLFLYDCGKRDVLSIRSFVHVGLSEHRGTPSGGGPQLQARRTAAFHF